MTIPCFIIDDEEPAVALLQFFISRCPQLELVGFAHHNTQLPATITDGHHLLFLDIETPFRNGLDFLRTQATALPVILTTSYSQYATDGFNLAVIDYLLKPFEEARFTQAVARAADHFALRQMKSGLTEDAFIVIKDNYKNVKLFEKDILYIEGWKQYVKIHTTGKIYMIIDTLKNMESLLSAQFVRCHKSYLVNKKQVTAFSQTHITIAGAQLPVGKTFRTHLERLFL
jgi:DNA-binding LytR/AlgR family response regulator